MHRNTRRPLPKGPNVFFILLAILALLVLLYLQRNLSQFFPAPQAQTAVEAPADTAPATTP